MKEGMKHLSKEKVKKVLFFHDGSPYHIETSSLTSSVNQETSFYMIGISVMEQLSLAVIIPYD